MEVNVGDYVRYKYSSKNNGLCDCVGIGKIIRISEYNTYHLDTLKPDNLFISEDFIIDKPQKNPIYLIKVKDYIDGHEVYKVTPSCIFTRGGINYHKKDSSIRSIVTKEQFSSMEYKLEDSNE